ncbi:hypothetical protein SAMN05428974_2653 [Sphingopyxis sp. YR583]|uniref:hypothetical protein n=1 Tax=Sphingopyxis sp. YR583 TaxID=1881047 RepID=UPI0008A7D1F9|nr:hypothetical protein [Sphingopyxis sp. YR583]SEH18420.1 hypothetical protein SAMN05428974_2653 [Sphingopyxis sp. YR583]
MRLAMTAILSVFALGGGVAATKPETGPFNGTWMACDNWQGSRICEYKMLAQRGDRVCGVQRYFATNAYYEQRFVGTARENIVNIEKICGDPGSETDSYCSGRAPSNAAKVGWQTTDRKLGLCNGRLSGDVANSHSCAGVSRRSGMPKVKNPGAEGPEPEERAWLAACARGEE